MPTARTRRLSTPPAEPGREELAEHVGDEVDRPRPRDLHVVEAEVLLERQLDDRVDLAHEVEAAIGQPGRDEELQAVAAQQLGVVGRSRVHLACEVEAAVRDLFPEARRQAR